MGNLNNFLNTIKTIKQNSCEKYLDKTYFICISKDLKQAKVNNVGLCSANVSYIIAASEYNWQNLWYTNTSIKTIGIFDKDYNYIDTIKLGRFELTNLSFRCASGSYYNAYTPSPEIQDSDTGKSIPFYDWNVGSITDFQSVLNEIWEKEKNYDFIKKNEITYANEYNAINTQDYNWKYIITDPVFNRKHTFYSKNKLNEPAALLAFKFFNCANFDILYKDKVKDFSFSENELIKTL